MAWQGLQWSKEAPKKSITALCKGTSSIECHTNYAGYFVAEYMAHWDQPKWIAGKAQHECEVEEWINLVDIFSNAI